MSATTSRKIALAEPLAVFALIMAYIWELRYSHRGAWLGILGLMLLSHRLRGERAEALGFRRRNLRGCLEELAPPLVFLALVLVACGILLQTTRPMRSDQAFWALAGYLPWGLFQQYVLNGYFLNRFDSALSRRSAPMISAALFSGVHLPNLFLMAVTFLAGYASVRIYRRYNNLYFLGLAHGTVGFLLLLVVPDSISHHLIVGPGWFVR
jgi:membrane protease YdiL (CAAX protease family)